MYTKFRYKVHILEGPKELSVRSGYLAEIFEIYSIGHRKIRVFQNVPGG